MVLVPAHFHVWLFSHSLGSQTCSHAHRHATDLCQREGYTNLTADTYTPGPSLALASHIGKTVGIRGTHTTPMAKLTRTSFAGALENFCNFLEVFGSERHDQLGGYLVILVVLCVQVSGGGVVFVAAMTL